MARNKTQPTGADVATFLDAVEPPQRRADARQLDALLRRLTGETPRLWGPSIVGYGERAYRTAAGRSDRTPRIAFSPRKPALALYVAETFPERERLLARLGRHRAGKACLHLAPLAQLDMAVLEALIAASLACRDGAGAALAPPPGGA